MSDNRSSLALGQQQLDQFDVDGYCMVRRLFALAEMQNINRFVNSDSGIRDATYARKDKTGAATQLALWYQLEDDIFSAIARSARIVDSLESTLGGEICFFHGKLSLKKPRTGGSWEWHQDYGYWYRDGYLFPRMASVLIALDPCTRENGCLQVIKGSHQVGRIEHGIVSGQIGADNHRVEEIAKQLETVDCEMQPGDALFFHCNLLHASGPNESEKSRNVLLYCYSRKDNAPLTTPEKFHHTLIAKLPDDELLSFFDKTPDASKRYHKA